MNPEKSYHYGQSDIPDELIQKLQQIFTDPARDDKATAAKHAIFNFQKVVDPGKYSEHAGPSNPEEVLVKQSDLVTWLNKIKELNQLRADLEVDIGWVSEAIDRVMNAKNPFKLVPKILTGRITMKELGLDDERLEAISRKYSPKTYERLKSKKS